MPPGTRHGTPPSLRSPEPPEPPDPPLGCSGAGRLPQRGSAGTSPVFCTPPRPGPKYGLYSSGNPGSTRGSPVWPPTLKFSTYTPPSPRALSKKYDPSHS